MSRQSLQFLLHRIQSVKGADPGLDAEIERTLRGNSEGGPGYSSSVDRCLDLMHDILPDWHWHVGRGASGVMPYAALSRGDQRVSAEGITVPLVLLAVIVKALLASQAA